MYSVHRSTWFALISPHLPSLGIQRVTSLLAYYVTWPLSLLLSRAEHFQNVLHFLIGYLLNSVQTFCNFERYVPVVRTIWRWFVILLILDKYLQSSESIRHQKIAWNSQYKPEDWILNTGDFLFYHSQSVGAVTCYWAVFNQTSLLPFSKFLWVLCPWVNQITIRLPSVGWSSIFRTPHLEIIIFSLATIKSMIRKTMN